MCRPRKTTWADGTSRQSAYNPDGTVYQTTDERGNVTTFEYGPDDQVEKSVVARAAGTPGFTLEVTTFDVLGRPIASTTDAGLGGTVHTITKSYDSRGLVLSESLDGLASTHEYDLAGNRTRSAYPSPGRSLVRGFDARDTLRTLAEVVGPTGTPVVRATFEPWGIARTGSIVRSSGSSGLLTAFAYDPRRLPESMSTRVGASAPTLDLAYVWGDARELISETRGPEGRSDVYAYDRVYRMTAAGLGQSSASAPDLGGRDTLSLSLGRVSTIDGVTRRLDGTSTSFTNETTPRNRYSLFLGQGHEQDAAGNETRNGRGTFEWDARNRLVKATTLDGTTLEYGYDALGRRVERRQTAPGATVFARFVYDGFEPVQEWSCTDCEAPVPTYALFREYLPSGSLDRPLELVTHTQNGPPEGSRFLLFPNVAGSIALVTDESGRPVERVRYLPHGAPTFDPPVSVRSISSTPTGGLDVELSYGFDPGTVTSQSVRVSGSDGTAIPATVTPASDGRTIRIRDAALTEGSQLRLTLTSAVTDPWGGTNGVDSSTSFVYRTGEKLFERQEYALDRSSRVGISRLWQGLEYEPALGLYYVRHRWYDPETGSFLSADPLGFPDGMNQYTWPYGNPWKQDPWGLRAPTILDRRDRDSVAAAYDAAIADFEGTGRFLGEEGRNIDTAALQEARAYSLGSFDAAVAAADENERVIRGGGRSFGARFWSLDPGVFADAFEVEKPWKDVAWAVVEQGVHGVNALVYAATIRGLTKQPVSGGVGARTFERSQSEQLVEAPSTESGLRAVNPVLPTRPGRPVGHVTPPEGETFGTARFGQKIEGPIQRWLEEQFPESDFFVRTGKGRTGIDAQAVGPKDPGFGFAEIKPRTPSGQKKFMSQMERWGRKPGPGPVPGPENTISLTYDAEGNIYVGW